MATCSNFPTWVSSIRQKRNERGKLLKRFLGSGDWRSGSGRVSLSILLVLGTGIGLSSISSWSNAGAAATTIGAAAIVWLVISQIIASLIGGYLAGRLRTKWVGIHTDEVYFRDTVHGFLVWGVGVLIYGCPSNIGGRLHGR